MLQLYRLGYFVLKYAFIGVLLAVFYANTVVSSDAGPRLYTDTEEIPYNEVGLLLGTSKYAVGGNVNLFFEYRIRAAVELFEAGKIDYLIASGDNSSSSYNEPLRMKEELVKRGIDADRVYLDYAGFRTLDSVIRTHRVFGQRRFTIISQGFHSERALYIAFEEGADQLRRNAAGWDLPFETMEASGNLRIEAAYPETAGLEDHLVRLKTAILVREILNVNPGLLSVENFSVGRRITIPQFEKDSDRIFLVDHNVSLYHFESEFYYAAFKNKLTKYVDGIRKVLQRYGR